MENGNLYEGAVRLPGWAEEEVRLLTKEAPLYRSVTESVPPVRLLKPDPGNRALQETTPVFEWEMPEETDTCEIKLM